MTERTGILIMAFVLCCAIVSAVTPVQAKDLTESSLRLRLSPADYWIAGEAVHTYDLTFGNEYGVMSCALKVMAEGDHQEAASPETTGDAVDLTLVYSEFSFRLEKPNEQMEALLRTMVNDSGVDSFEYRARIGKYGNLISSDLRRCLEPLLKSSHEPTRQLASNMLRPMVENTWLYLFPRLAPIGADLRLCIRDMNDYEAFGWPELQRSMARSGMGVYLNVLVGRYTEPLSILWANVTHQLLSKEYGADRDVKQAIKIDIRYDKDARLVRRASMHRTIMTSDEENKTDFFKGVLRTGQPE